jgi:hypothetical protein
MNFPYLCNGLLTGLKQAGFAALEKLSDLYVF